MMLLVLVFFNLIWSFGFFIKYCGNKCGKYLFCVDELYYNIMLFVVLWVKGSMVCCNCCCCCSKCCVCFVKVCLVRVVFIFVVWWVNKLILKWCFNFLICLLVVCKEMVECFVFLVRLFVFRILINNCRLKKLRCMVGLKWKRLFYFSFFCV